MSRFYFCSYEALINGSVVNKGHYCLEVSNEIEDFKLFMDDVQQTVRVRNRIADDATVVFTAFNKL